MRSLICRQADIKMNEYEVWAKTSAELERNIAKEMEGFFSDFFSDFFLLLLLLEGQPLKWIISLLFLH